MLEPLARDRSFEVWADEHIQVENAWRPEIEDPVRRAALAVLLMSPGLPRLALHHREALPALVRQGAPLVCVLVRPCAWETGGGRRLPATSPTGSSG
jgi:hypothetical protein